MAAKKPIANNVERKYIIPLRKEFNKVPNYRKTQKAIKAIRNFIIKHMKVNEVKISKELNLEIWKHGRQNPPAKIEIKTIKEDNHARVTLPNLPFEKKKEKKAPKAEGLKGKLQEKMEGLKSEPKKDVKEEKVKAEEKKTSGEDTQKAQDKKPVQKAANTQSPKQPKGVRSY